LIVKYLVKTFHHLNDPSSDAETNVPIAILENPKDLIAFVWPLRVFIFFDWLDPTTFCVTFNAILCDDIEILRRYMSPELDPKAIMSSVASAAKHSIELLSDTRRHCFPLWISLIVTVLSSEQETTRGDLKDPNISSPLTGREWDVHERCGWIFFEFLLALTTEVSNIVARSQARIMPSSEHDMQKFPVGSEIMLVTPLKWACHVLNKAPVATSQK
jgi:hypothetical protein